MFAIDSKRGHLMREKYENKVYAGSLTVEAAIAVPLFLFLMMTLLSMIDMLHFYGRVEQGLHQEGAGWQFMHRQQN